MAMPRRWRPRRPHVADVRGGIGLTRRALGRADAVLAVADDALERADRVAVKARRWAPTVAVVMGVMTVAVVAAGVTGTVILVRRRKATKRAAEELDRDQQLAGSNQTG